MTDEKTPTEQPDDKAMQDHTFGKQVAEMTEEAEGGAEHSPKEGEPEPHAGGKA